MRAPLLQTLYRHPNRLFLIDGLGALLTAAGLLLITYPFDEYFHLPRPIVRGLMWAAVGFSVYSFACARRVGPNWQLYLRAISFANGLYGCITLALVAYHFPALSYWEISYFTIEALLITGLVWVELKVASKPAD